MASAGSTASPRLLANLLTHEKEYAKALATLVDAGGAAGTALILYQPWLNHHGGGSEDGHGRSVLQSLALADVGLRTYAAAFESYVEGLKELRDLEDSVRNLIRDREILVTRVLKVSNKSSNRDSIFMTASPSHSTVSLDTLNGKSYALGGKSSKLPHWQAELHGCEAQLANAQRSLEAKRVSAVRDGLRLRATAMIECGTRWTEAGRAILQMNADAPLPPLPDISAQLDKPLPDDSSSLTPSQSASQTEADLDLYIPPAHSIADTGLPTSVPHVLSRRITEEELNENASSSSDEEAETEVVENPRFNATTSKRTKTSTAPSPTSPGDETPVRPRFFGTFRGFFSHKKTSSVNGDAEDPEEKLAKPRKARTWDTRTDKNIRKVDAIPSPSSPSASQIFDGATPRARRLRKNSPEKRTRRRSASVDGAIPDLSASAVSDDSTPVPATRKRSTKKKRVEGDLSPMSRLSRNDSITSAPATFSARAASPAPPLPTTPSNPSHKKQASLGTHGLTPTKTERRASLPPHQNASTSLMSIVEDVTRSNRMATMVTEDRGRERAISGGLVSVKAPQSLSRKEIDGLPMDSLLSGGRERTSSTVSVGGKQQQPKVTTLFEVKAPTSSTREALETLPAGSVVIASSMAPPSSPPPTRPSIIRSPPTSNGPPVVATSSTSSSSSSRPAPLRSALRNGGSRTPSPLSSAGREPSPPTSKLLVVHAPSPLHAVATAPALETAAERTSPPVKSGTSNVSPPPVASKTSSPPLEQERAHSPYLDDDTASISSYETTNEVFGDDNDATPTPPEKEYVVLTPGVSTTLPQTNGVNGTDVSASSDSTVASPPKRRKSVRVSLRPTFSPTPPAIEYDEWQPSEKNDDDDDGHGERNGRSWSSKDVEPPDMWQDSSDEDEQYSAARRLLNRVAKKEKKAKSS